MEAVPGPSGIAAGASAGGEPAVRSAAAAGAGRGGDDTRWRLSTGTALATVLADVRAITGFARSFPSLQRGPEALTRELIEVHLAHLVATFPNPKSRTGQISSLAGLLRAARQHGWEPSLPPQAELYREDYPRLMAGAARALPETVMTQLERDENLARFANPAGRLLAKILVGTGLRVGDGCKLALDCIVRDGQGAPYLRYVNHKMSRDAFVPIDDGLADAIQTQQQAVLARYPQARCLLPRATRNLDGMLPFSPATFRGQLIDWLRICDIRDELGRPVHLTPHQWRHTFGTRLKMSRIASSASFRSLRERGLPAAQAAAPPCRPRGVAWRGVLTCGNASPGGWCNFDACDAVTSGASLLRLIDG